MIKFCGFVLMRESELDNYYKDASDLSNLFTAKIAELAETALPWQEESIKWRTAFDKLLEQLETIADTEAIQDVLKKVL